MRSSSGGNAASSVDSPERPGPAVTTESDVHGQRAHQVRCDWGPQGARSLTAEVIVVVDVLSFSTTVTVAAERGIQVLPYPWRDQRAEAFARQHDAVLAVGRGDAVRRGSGGGLGLSPVAMARGEWAERLVLPSPNGSTIVAAVAETGAEVMIGCLRNATAVAAVLADRMGAGRTIAVLPAGERWEADNSLRPALEDHLGAGAILEALTRADPEADLSPEARACRAVFEATRSTLEQTLLDCVGGRELTLRGFRDDVLCAASLDASTTVPVLSTGRLVPMTPPTA